MTRFLPDYANAAVPRYTSYPTALQFHELDEQTYRRWLRSLRQQERLSVYLHVPFCQQLCWYCGCATEVSRRSENTEAYARTLEQEIEMVSALAAPTGGIGHLHFGGGTPTQLTPVSFRRLFSILDRSFGFAADAERAVEVDPRRLEPDMAEAFARSGINRVSLGVQDIDREVQALINRHQPLDLVLQTVARLREVGIERISMDMIYGLPGQTAAHVRATARAIADAGASRVSVFGYAHVPWFRKHQKAIDEARLPGSAERFEQMLAAADELQSAGYINIGFDHFARPDDGLVIASGRGRLRRNFQGYTDDQASTLLGFGSSSIGSLPDGYVQNAATSRDWRAMLSEDRLPVVRGYATTFEDRLRRRFIEEIMCYGALDAAAICRDFGADTRQAEQAFTSLSPLADDGLVTCDGQALTLQATETGRLYLRNIAACFDPTHTARAGRHSRAI
ncbi:MAG: oxygen-independent coproporphyrinogen III oxidase [Rhodospirillales bacterium]